MERAFLERCLSSGMSTRQIEKICNLDHRTIGYWISKYGLNSASKYRKNPPFKFEKIDTPEKAYALGFMLADASISNTNVETAVGIADKEAAEFIANIINGNLMYDYTFDKKTRRFPRCRVNKKIADITKFTGGEKKAERHYPRVPKHLERYLLQGFFDADGCITWGYRKDRNRLWHKISFTSQLKILTGVQQYLINIGISSVVRQKSNEKCYVLEFANKADILKFINHIYPDDNFIVLKRKYLKAKALRLELEENGESESQRRAEPTE